MRGRWRWILLCAYIFLIYSTLGLVGRWSEILDEQGLTQIITGPAVALLLFLPIGWGWQRASWKQRLGRVATGSLLLITALWVDFPEERIHLVEYGLLGLMLGWAFKGSRRWPDLWPLAVALAWIIGWGDELIQAVLPNRVYDVRDIVLNGLAGMAGLYLFETHCERDSQSNMGHDSKKYSIHLFLTAYCLLLTPYSLLSTASSLLPTPYSLAASYSPPRVHFMDVGEGAATWIEVGDGRHILVDTGNVITGAGLLTMLQRAGVERLEAIIITHPHPDHMGGIFHLLPFLKVDRVLDNGQAIAALPSCDIYRWYVESVRSRANYGVLSKGDRLQYGPVNIEVLWPPAPSSGNWNSNALVIRLNIENTRILLMSDAGHHVEAALLKEDIDLMAEVLQVGHHGARDASSEKFLKAVAPERAVISVNSDNVRGYPSKDVLERLRATGADVLLTSDNGTWTWGGRVRSRE